MPFSELDTAAVARTLSQIAEQPEDLSELKASRRLHLHFLHSPVEIYDDAETPGKVAGMRFERTELDGTGNVKGTGRFTDWDVQSVYRAVGYYSEELPKLPFDVASGTVPHAAGRVLRSPGRSRRAPHRARSHRRSARSD